jgi:hypothetical protein
MDEAQPDLLKGLIPFTVPVGLRDQVKRIHRLSRFSFEKSFTFLYLKSYALQI